MKIPRAPHSWSVTPKRAAEIQRELGESERAAELLELAIRLYRKLPPTDPNSSVNSPWLLQALLEAAEVQTELGNLEAAAEFEQSARANLELLQGSTFSESLQAAHRKLMELEN